MKRPGLLEPSACEKCKPQYPTSEGWDLGELRVPLEEIVSLQIVRATMQVRPMTFPMMASSQEVKVVWILPMDLVAVTMTACLQNMKDLVAWSLQHLAAADEADSVCKA